jgi:hypothetical protein
LDGLQFGGFDFVGIIDALEFVSVEPDATATAGADIHDDAADAFFRQRMITGRTIHGGIIISCGALGKQD